MLSDACSAFLDDFEHAAQRLAEAVLWYSGPDYEASYGEEIGALLRACTKVQANLNDVEARAELIRLSASVMSHHDTPPDNEDSAHRK